MINYIIGQQYNFTNKKLKTPALYWYFYQLRVNRGHPWWTDIEHFVNSVSFENLC